MNATMPVPIWLVLLLMFVAVAWHICETLRTKYITELWKLYLQQTTEYEEPGAPAPEKAEL